MKAMIKLLYIGVFAGAMAGLLAPAGAADPPAPIKPRKPGNALLTGKLKAVDKINKTITIEGKEKESLCQVTSQTRISKATKPATLDDGVVGEDIAAIARETAEGKLEAISIRFGPKAAVAPKPSTGKKESEKP